MTNLNVLTCRNPECRHNIPLPLPTHPHKIRHQPWWPMDGNPRNFLCPKCMHVFEYSSFEVRPVSAGHTDQSLVQKCNNVVCVEIQCGESGCAARPQIHILMHSGKDMYEEVPAVLQRAIFHDTLCGGGHFLNGCLQSAPQLHVRWDNDWERIGV